MDKVLQFERRTKPVDPGGPGPGDDGDGGPARPEGGAARYTRFDAAHAAR